MFSDKNIDSNLIHKVFFALCKSVDTPFSLASWLLFKHQEHAQLLQLSVRAENYADADSFHLDYTVCSFLSKYKGLHTGIDTKAVAIDSFIGAESACAEANMKFQQAKLRGFSPRAEAVLFTARRKIANLLGPCYPFQVLQNCMWGPGVTGTVKGSRCTMANKIGEMPIRVSRSAIPYLEGILGGDIHWAQALGIPAEGPFSPLPSVFKPMEYSTVTTVPKNAKTDRTIAIEPTGNIFLQKGAGAFIRRKLRLAGVDLNDQRINQNLARIGSLYGTLSTIDMKAASDTLSRGLIDALLPLDWYHLLDDIRTRRYLLDKEVKTFSKFSTMGNGFTFELESLVFWGLSQAISDLYSTAENRRVSVYGDDIIVPSDISEVLMEIFPEFGLTLNREKSFTQGPFRESCGGHYYFGSDVTPIYQKEIPNVLEEVYRLANRIRRLAYRMGAYTCCRAEFYSAWLAASQFLSRRHVVPLDCETDDGLALDFTELAGHLLPKGHGGYTLPVYRFASPPSRDGGNPGLALWFRLRKEVEFETDVHAVRRRGRYVSRRSYFTSTLHAPWA